ncbi:MAG: hypothetical protein H6698_06200 [Myxococcales bacterium]|nr:hypothetical protein [Myxococcales bacterium]MCB9531930.1 hypothetical protein [Myxococcales bacterium]MCB9533898.1 hypothetical protein [Myxococcales bacterium]
MRRAAARRGAETAANALAAGLVAVLAAATAGCRTRPSEGAPREIPPAPGPDVAEASGSDTSGVEAPTRESLAGAPPPAVLPAEQSCARNEDCRVHQPSDWNVRVECCYEYGCELDYVAINQTTWAALRAWQAANRFDCAAELQREGPCATRAPRCGLSQDPPAAVCVDGLCTVATPTSWPVIDAAAQRCTAPGDCGAFDTATTSLRSRCCGSACGGEWVPINRSTALELAAWTAAAPPCDGFDRSECPADPCDEPAPAVTCRGGQCVLE